MIYLKMKLKSTVGLCVLLSGGYQGGVSRQEDRQTGRWAGEVQRSDEEDERWAVEGEGLHPDLLFFFFFYKE